MDEQLKTKLIQYLDRLEGAASKVGEAAATEIPETIREYLAWLLIENVVLAISFLIPLVVMACVTKRVVRCLKEFDDMHPIEFFGPIGLVVGWTIAAVSLIGVVTHGLYAVKVAVAPRVVLIEKVGELIKSSR